MFILDMCDAIIRHYCDEVIACPTCPEDWLEIEQGFRKRGTLPHTLGPIHRKHIPIRCHRREGSNYFNCKCFHSMVLLAMVDMAISSSGLTSGLSSDSQIFIYGDLRQKIEDTTVGFPQAESLVDHGPHVEYIIVGGDAYPLQTGMMKPFSHRSMDLNERVFNYQLNRRRVLKKPLGFWPTDFGFCNPPCSKNLGWPCSHSFCGGLFTLL